jgi:hypothetical protein
VILNLCFATIKIQFFLFNHRNLTKLILHRVH